MVLQHGQLSAAHVAGHHIQPLFRASSGANELTDERMTAAAWRQGRFVWLTEENGDASRLFLVREIREMENMTLDNLGYMLIEVDFPRWSSSTARPWAAWA